MLYQIHVQVLSKVHACLLIRELAVRSLPPLRQHKKIVKQKMELKKLHGRQHKKIERGKSGVEGARG